MTHLASSLLHLELSTIPVSSRSIGPRLSTNLSYLILVDTIRVRVQTRPSSSPCVGKPLLPMLYAGLPVTIGFSAPALALYYTVYDGMCHIVTELSSKKHPNRFFFVSRSHIAAKLFWAPTLFPSAYHTASMVGQPQLDAPSADVLAVWADR